MLSEGKTLWTSEETEMTVRELSAGLPNIEGDIGWAVWNNHPNGAFYVGPNVNAKTSYLDAGPYESVRLNASRYNSIYGNSTTVQPPAIKVYMYRRIS